MDDSDEGTSGARNAKGCGCLFGLVAFAFMFLYVGRWMSSHARPVHLAISLGCAAIALYLARTSVREIFRRTRSGIDPTAIPVPLADVKVGKLTHTTGLVGIHDEPHHAPLGAPSVCVFHRVVITNIEARKVVLDARSSEDIVLDDGMGARIRVHLDGASFVFARHHDLFSSPELTDPLVAQFLAERGIEVDYPVRARVEWIAPHELVFVRGVARESGAGEGGYRTSEHTELEMRAAPGEPVIVSLDELGDGGAAPTGV